MTEAEELEKALMRAHNAGDYDSAQMLAQELQKIQQGVQQGVQETPSNDRGIFGSLTDAAGEFYDESKELITGEKRSTPEIEALPDFNSMPITESAFDVLTGLKVAGSSLFADTDETVKILQENIPGLEARKDSKGNYILKNPYDEKEYAIKPGFRATDVPKVIGNVLAFSPAGRASTLLGRAASAAGTQTGIETLQALSGGEFNPQDIAMAGATQVGGDLVGRQITAISPKSKLASQVVDEAADELSVEQMIKATKGASDKFFSGGARRVLEESALPDKEILESAQRLGIEEYLQPDHISSNPIFKQLAEGIRSTPISQSRRVEREGLEKVMQKAQSVIEDLGGNTDFSDLNINIKSKLQETQDQLLKQSEEQFKAISNAIDPKASAPAENVLNFIKKRADNLGSVQDLSAMEKKILNRLSPKVTQKTGNQSVLDKSLGKKPKKIIENKYPPYARLDDIRKSLTAARIKRQGPFKDADTGLLKKLENELLLDQKNVAEKFGVLDDFNIARDTVKERKKIEDNIVSLFGKNLDNSIVKPLISGTKELSKGDVSNFTKFLKRVPEDMRKEVSTSALSVAFTGGKKGADAIDFKSYVDWYDGLNRNKQAKNALFSNLPKEAKQTLKDFYNISKGISTSSKEYIGTGRILLVQDQLANADNLIGQLYQAAKKFPAVAVSEAVSSTLGAPGAGFSAAIASSLNAGKAEAVKQADALISSPVFIKNAKLGTREAAENIAKSSPFIKYAKKIGMKQNLSERIRFITNAFQGAKTQEESQ